MLRRFIVALSLFIVIRSADAQTTRWYAVELFGSRAGVMKQTEERKGDSIVSSSDMSFDINRGAMKISISMQSSFTETAEGKPVAMRSVQNMGLKPMTQEFEFKADGVHLTTLQGDQRSERTLATPAGDWLTPAAADRFMTQRFKSGAREIKLTSIDPSNGLTPVTTTRRIGEKSKMTAMGREIEVTRCTSVVSSAPGIESVEWLDEEGVLVKTETQMGAIRMVMTICTEAEASNKTPGAEIPDAFTGTFIKPDLAIDSPRQLKKGVYLLSVAEGSLETPPTTGSQTFERLSPREGRLTVVTDVFSPAPKADESNAAYLASTGLCNINDEEVKRLAAAAVKHVDKDATTLAKAMACRGFVHSFIRTKSLNVGFASATEVARTREGDCTEHGVLLCALLRANGIPARVVSGLVYADSFAGANRIFGYHMWAQGLIEIDGAKRWVDLDGTLPSVSYDATHICLGLSELADGDITSTMSSLATTMGRLRIKVVEPAGGKPNVDEPKAPATHAP